MTGVDMSLDENVLQENVEENVLATEELELPPQLPDAHFATITSVELVTFDSGTQGIKVNLLADAGFEERYTFFPPAEFMQNIAVSAKDLPDVPPEGKKQGARERYTRTVANSAKTADVQRLFAIGADQGRSFNTDAATNAIGKSKAETIEEFVSILNFVLSGTQAIIKRRPDTKAEDARYRGRLRVVEIVPTTDANNPKAFKNYARGWDSGE